MSQSNSNRVVLWESSDKPLVLAESSGCAFFYRSDHIPLGLTLFSSLWRLAVESVGVHTIEDLHTPHLVWTLDDRQKFFHLLGSAFAPALELMPMLAPCEPRRVLVCNAGGQPFGHYFQCMALRPARYIALLIMFFGHRNAAPCNHCGKRYANTCATNTPVDNPSLVHVNYPFHHCISHPLINNGKCANCVYHVCTDCEYNTNNPTFNKYKCISSRAARVDKSPKKPPSRREDTMVLSKPMDWKALRKADRKDQKQKYNIGDDVETL